MESRAGLVEEDAPKEIEVTGWSEGASPSMKAQNIMASIRPRRVFPTPGSPRSQRAWPRRWGTTFSMISRTSGSMASIVRLYREMTAAMVPSLAKESKALWTSFSFHPWIGLPSPLMLRWIQRSCLRLPLSRSPCWMMKSHPASWSSPFAGGRPAMTLRFSALKEKRRNWLPPSCSSMYWNPLLALCLLTPCHEISKPWPFTKRATYCPLILSSLM